MKKRTIIESPFLPATRTRVCSHLKEIVLFLENEGTIFDWKTGLIPDKNDGMILLADAFSDINKISDVFQLPDFIVANSHRELISCRKCWCSIEKKKKGKIFNSSIQPLYNSFPV